MAARTKSKVTPKYKTKYRVKNWPAYEEGLRKRGDITVWFDGAAIERWNSAPTDRRPGGKQLYSDLAILTALTLRTVFHLPLRQTEGFVSSLIRLMDFDLETPDTPRSPEEAAPSMCRRSPGCKAAQSISSSTPPA